MIITLTNRVALPAINTNVAVEVVFNPAQPDPGTRWHRFLQLLHLRPRPQQPPPGHYATIWPMLTDCTCDSRFFTGRTAQNPLRIDDRLPAWQPKAADIATGRSWSYSMIQ